MRPRKGVTRLQERQRPVEELLAEAVALIGRAWRTRYETMRSPSPDDDALQETVERVRADLARAAEICRRAGAMRELSVALGKLGHVAEDRGRPDEALQCFEESVAAARAAGDPLRLAHAVRHLGQAHHGAGQLELAGACYDEAVAIYRRRGASPTVDLANAIRPMAILKEESGDLDGAGELWREAAELYRAAGVEEGVEECEVRLAKAAESQRD